MERERMLEELAAIPARHETAVKDYQERYGAAVAYRAHHQEMMRLAGEADMQWSHLNAHKHESAGRLRDALRQNPPHVLANAIRYAEAQVKARKSLGTSERVFGQVPGGQAFTSERDRTDADRAATVRAEQALGKLNGLYEAPDDVIEDRVKAILDELAAADAAALWDKPVAPVPAPRRKRRPPFNIEGEMAELIPNDGESSLKPREQLAAAR
jgi:hypothetical protein